MQSGEEAFRISRRHEYLAGRGQADAVFREYLVLD